ncbi:hypothetical protein BDP55DRAFT_626835 [Colletotrichum godetiae]|uniref:Uncharacterized protein n=1 Tax=Colletotrichum godetiae TaxID=1209918 RepID=A0AAJ0AYE7_9PEZI|nr:uncharacterized protein BDP55DRAFT_626835 [Colletotrichum godetiae]KAK1691145.1 hypothetical protein BDP55DRAFT_626835 [Colletotrichum godetiae]
MKCDPSNERRVRGFANPANSLSRKVNWGPTSEKKEAEISLTGENKCSCQGSLGQVQARGRIASTVATFREEFADKGKGRSVREQGGQDLPFRMQMQAEPVSCELQNKGPQATPAPQHPTPGTQAGWEAQVPEKLKNDQHKGGNRVGGRWKAVRRAVQRMDGWMVT